MMCGQRRLGHWLPRAVRYIAARQIAFGERPVMVQPKDRAEYLSRFGTFPLKPLLPIEEHDLARLLASETLTFDDIKTLMRGARYTRGHDETFTYADSLLPEASDYLPSRTLRALVRADISEEESASHLEQNKAFFRRLVVVLPSIVSFFGKEARLRNPSGIVMTIDDCYYDFVATGNALRRDRQIREAKDKLMRAARSSLESATALRDAASHFKFEFGHYQEAYYRPVPGPTRSLDDLIEELEMCAGVLEIVHEIADIKPKRLFVFGNDQRTNLVEAAYHMCTMWDGPKLVTTPGSDFAALCSLLFEAVSGNTDEGLAGAINRYARGDDRKQWDREGEDDDPDNNFMSENTRMTHCAQEIHLCKRIRQNTDLSDMALLLLNERIKYDEQQYEGARTKYGPRQVYLSQMNQEQWEGMLLEAISRWKPEQVDDLDDMITKGQSLAGRDIEHGQRVRAARNGSIDAKSER
jgi:hypothetical protein